MTSEKSRRAVTLSRIAGQLGLSQSTVSRALSGHPAIKADTRARVMAAAHASAYEGVRRSAKARPTKMIGVVVSALHNQFYVQLLDPLHEALRAYGFHMTLIVDSLANSDDISAFEPLLHQYLDGVVITTGSIDPRVAATLRDGAIPAVLAVRSIAGAPYDTVEVDNRTAGQQAAQHLHEIGHRHIGFLMGPRDTSTSRDRFAGAFDWLAAVGAPPSDMFVRWGAYTHDAGYSAMISVLAGGDPPTAVVCGNDTIAIGALEAAARRGIEVPRQLSVIGFDDIPMASWEMVQLTTVRQPITEMAHIAAQRLVERIRDKTISAPRHDVLPVDLIRRRTTAPPRD